MGLDLISACGGLAICAGCRVNVEGESPAEPSAARLNAAQLAAGHRLACATPVVGDTTVHVPASLTRPVRVAASASTVSPLVTVHDLVLGPESGEALTDRVVAACVDASPTGTVAVAEQVGVEAQALRDRGASRVRLFAVHGPERSVAESVVPAEDVPDGPALGLVALGREGGSVVQIVNLTTAREVLEIRHPAPVRETSCRESANLLDLAAQAHDAIRLHGFEGEQLLAAIVLCGEVGPGVDRHDATLEIEGVGRWHRAAELRFPIHPAAPVVHASGGALGPSVAALAALPAFLSGARVHVQIAENELWVVVDRADEWSATCVQCPGAVPAETARQLFGEWLAADGAALDDPAMLVTVGGDTRVAAPADRTLLASWLGSVAPDRVQWIGDARLAGLRALLTSHAARTAWSRRDPILRVERLRTHRD